MSAAGLIPVPPTRVREAGPGAVIVNQVRIQLIGLLYFLLYIIAYTLSFLAVHGYTLVTRGQSIGKLILGTQILDVNTKKIPAVGGMIIRRHVSIQMLPLVPCIGGLIAFYDAISIFFDPDHRMMHDHFADTVVVYYEKNRRNENSKEPD